MAWPRVSDDVPHRRRSVLTWLLMLTWAAIWILQWRRPDNGNLADSFQALTCRWGMVPDHVMHGAGGAAGDPCLALSAEHSPWLQVLSAQFLHASWLHVIVNITFLMVFARSVEERLGRVRFLPFVVMISSLSFVAEALISPSSMQPIIGGSGIVAVVLGAYMVLFPRATIGLDIAGRRIAMAAWVPIVLWIAFEVIAVVGGGDHGTAHWVHVVSFALGALLIRAATDGRRTRAEVVGT
ncbi:MAG: rhomboid family intramembrane serine protease [Thermoleophilia bacterium]|nr:rhomboid family intramembrane serine protease [Thermoleophilia bacterium]